MISQAPGSTSNVRCHCCGRDCFQAGGLERVYGGGDTGVEPVWSCFNHIGRLPCIIEGCGRTFRLSPGESYDHEIVCGRHWRMAPQRMRDAVARVRRLSRRHGWSDDLVTRHNRLWNRCITAARSRLEGGSIDIAEIERMFG